MFESPQTYTWASLLWNFSKFRSNKILAESPLNRTKAKISLAPVSVWGFPFILFFSDSCLQLMFFELLWAAFSSSEKSHAENSCLRLMFLNCFELHLVTREEPCRERDKLGCLKYFCFSSKKQLYQITFKLEAYTSSFPYKFRMRIKSLVRKRCAKVDSLLTWISFLNQWDLNPRPSTPIKCTKNIDQAQPLFGTFVLFSQLNDLKSIILVISIE